MDEVTPRVFETQWTIVYINLKHSKGLLSEENEVLSPVSSFEVIY